MDIIDKLSLKNQQKERELLIQKILSNYYSYNLEMFILPSHRKDCWPVCADLLSRLPDEEFLKLLPKVLEWYQDRTWPGIFEIERRIFTLPLNTVIPICQEVYMRALRENDTEWMYNLESVFGPDVMIKH